MTNGHRFDECALEHKRKKRGVIGSCAVGDRWLWTEVRRRNINERIKKDQKSCEEQRKKNNKLEEESGATRRNQNVLDPREATRVAEKERKKLARRLLGPPKPQFMAAKSNISKQAVSRINQNPLRRKQGRKCIGKGIHKFRSYVQICWNAATKDSAHPSVISAIRSSYGENCRRTEVEALQVVWELSTHGAAYTRRGFGQSIVNCLSFSWRHPILVPDERRFEIMDNI
ncbi:unnamed protein product [Caenorhabditis auriculariae]|uniref:Uncharacterized protein n=1 Tax=Caenorhabditis auriculariae TaxID=2777116 RepID=A0A8S1HBK2_9PELO|nr:unnamed protein product [Caenorhabditis auriculariae]